MKKKSTEKKIMRGISKDFAKAFIKSELFRLYISTPHLFDTTHQKKMIPPVLC